MKSSIIEKAKKIIENKHYEAEREALNNKEEALKDPVYKQHNRKCKNWRRKSRRRKKAEKGCRKKTERA